MDKRPRYFLFGLLRDIRYNHGMTGIYIHIPFCNAKCNYCNFVSQVGGDKKAYIMALVKEIAVMDAFHNGKADTVFFGGGTPSTIKPYYIEQVLNTLRQSMTILPDAEITLEANPGTVSYASLKDYRRLGINRLSFGLQSVDNAELGLLGRIHTYQEFLASYHAAREAGFDNINIDIIFGLPGQTVAGFLNTIKTVTRLVPEHLSVYALKLEKGTPMHHDYYGSPDMPGEDAEREMYHAAVAHLTDNGYIHYETSNFAKPGFECRHNLKYWTGEPYIGYGVAAHGYYPTETGAVRTENTSDIETYVRDLNDGIHDEQTLTPLSHRDIRDEYIMLRLRLAQGIRFDDFKTHFGMDFEAEHKNAIEKTLKAGLITKDDKGIYPTIKGFDLQNTLITEFL